jgi:hypothetical protein
MRCHAEESHHETDHLFAPLTQNLDGRRCHSNEKVEMAIFERLRFENSLSTATEFLNGC